MNTPAPGRKSKTRRVSGARPIRRRRTAADIQRIERELYEILDADKPQTVRQVYYRAVCLGLIEKTEAAYKSIICRLLTAMRKRGEIPFEWLADNTRWMRKPKTYSSLKSAILSAQQYYRRDLWMDQDAYVEVWLEKEALAGVLVEVTEEWDVPLMVTRGYPSLSFLHSAAEQIEDQEKPTHIYYFGDYDPSGLDISRCVKEGLRDMAPDADITFARVAVTQDQIEMYGLPTRPTKRTDSRSKAFADYSVEVDALPAADLRRICRSCIEEHVDRDRHEKLLLVEREERAKFEQIAMRLDEVA
jgi:hypothetical protein